MRILIFGHGFLGQRALGAWGDDAILSERRISTREDALAEIKKYQPDAVLNAIGITGKPNVDWCDITDNRVATMRGNVIIPLEIADACQEAGVYLLHMGSGCIYYGDSPHPDKAWRENDHGNPEPVYSRSKLAADLMLSTLPNVGIGRVRMPIDHIPGSRNLIDKLAKYPKIIDVENSVTVIDDMLNVFHQLMEKKAPGIFHVTNPGTMKHRDLMALYVELVNPAHTNEWITAEDLVAQGLATKLRSNNFLASERLGEFGILMRPISIALRDTMEKYAANVKAARATF